MEPFKEKTVQLGQREDENVIVLCGVKEGERVVTEGQMNLTEGTSVFISGKDR